MPHPATPLDLSRAKRTHRAFASALRRTRAGSRAYQQLHAGLAVLDLVDRRWARPQSPTGSIHHCTAVRRAIGQVRPTALRSALLTVLDQIVGGAPNREVLMALSGYAAHLRRYRLQALAANVYRAIVPRARAANAPDCIAGWYEELAHCLSESGDRVGALMACERGYAVATERGDATAVLRITLARAIVVRADRRLPEAGRILDDLLVAAETRHDLRIVARAAHERALVAYDGGDPIAALTFYGRALRACVLLGKDAREQYDHTLVNTGRALLALGLRDVARKAYVHVYLAGQSRYVRWDAAIQLMRMAVGDRREHVFDQYRLDLAQTRMPAPYLAAYHIVVGRGSRRFGRDQDARKALNAVKGLAAQHGRALTRGGTLRTLAGWSAGDDARPPAPSALPSIAAQVVDIVNDLRPLTQAGVDRPHSQTGAPRILRAFLTLGRPKSRPV